MSESDAEFLSRIDADVRFGDEPLHEDDRLRLLSIARKGAEAADEITRLRNELHIAQEWSARVIAGHEHDMAEITSLRAEVEKLKDFETEFCQQNSDLGKALLENEKLRAVLEAIANCQPKEDHNCNTNDLVACRVVNLARAALGDTP